MGYQVTVYEALHLPGGVLATASPSSGCPLIVQSEIDALRDMGVAIEPTWSSAER